jgi:iron complex transport system ATP-binding protein
MNASPPLIDVRGLTIERGHTAILRRVDWEVRACEHWVILGANGSGKTSLLCALAGYMVPSAGNITVLGCTFGKSDWRELRRHIGLVSSAVRQRIDGSESAREVVASGRHAMLNFWGPFTRRDQREAARWLDKVGCMAIARRPWAVLSQGERQRVLVARALSANPRLLILDEPCAGLDPVARESFLAFLESLSRSSRCPGLVLVTHHVEEITPGFTHVLMLRKGRVAATGRLATTLTSQALATTFDAAIRLRRQNGRFTATIGPPGPLPRPRQARSPFSP